MGADSTPDTPDPDRRGTEERGPDTRDAGGRGGQERLPLEVGESWSRGHGGDPDKVPVRYSLTARARRAVAPESLPELSVIGGTRAHQPALDAPAEPAGDPEDSGDTRPARARALRRAGMSWREIADEVGVDPVLVRAWVEEVGPVVGAAGRVGAGAADRNHARDRDVRRTFEVARRRARGADGPSPAARPGALGLLAGALEVDGPAVTLATGDRRLGAAVLHRLRTTFDVGPDRLRVVLRMGPGVAGDRATEEWSRALGIPTERITPTRWTAAPRGDATEILVRLTDPEVAGTVAGCRDRVLERLAEDAGAPPAEVPLGA